MTSDDVFSLGIKTIGLMCFAWGIESLFDVLPTALKYANPLISIEGGLLATKWLYLVIPPLLVTIGACLMKSEAALLSRFIVQENERSLNATTLLTVTIRLFGVFLILSQVATCISILINLAVIWFAAQYMDTELERVYARSYFLPCSIGIAWGAFCLFKGQLITPFVYRYRTAGSNE